MTPSVFNDFLLILSVVSSPLSVVLLRELQLPNQAFGIARSELLTGIGFESILGKKLNARNLRIFKPSTKTLSYRGISKIAPSVFRQIFDFWEMSIVSGVAQVGPQRGSNRGIPYGHEFQAEI